MNRRITDLQLPFGPSAKRRFHVNCSVIAGDEVLQGVADSFVAACYFAEFRSSTVANPVNFLRLVGSNAIITGAGELGIKYGVLVGVSEFHGSDETRPLPLAVNDAVRLFDVLTEHCGFSEENLKLLTEPTTDMGTRVFAPPTHANILSAIEEVSHKATEDDWVVLFIASHGIELSHVPYILTSDTKMNVVDETAIKVAAINDLLLASAASFTLRLFDACRSPFSMSRSTPAMSRNLHDQIFMTAKGWSTISSCSSGQFSYEEPSFGHGVFSHYLCEGLSGKAANDAGLVTLDRLIEYIKTSVINWATEQSLSQTPHSVSDVSGIVPLAESRAKAIIEPSLNPSHPLDELYAGLRNQLANVKPDVRNLAFTTKEIANLFFANVQQSVNEVVATHDKSLIDLVVLPIREDNTTYAPLNAAGHIGSQIEKTHLTAEHVSSKALSVEFSSKELFIPNSKIVLVCSRFSFIYWLWYRHECEVPALHKRFKADPASSQGFLTFGSNAAIDSSKVSSAVNEVFARCSPNIILWSQQLNEFINNRLEPIRAIERIIE